MGIFDYNGDINKNAYMNWRIWDNSSISDNFLMMSEGYFKAAEILVEELLNDNLDKKADCIIFPLMFNFIHGIELSLKAILNSIDTIINNSSLPRIEGGHDIQQILNTLMSWLRKNGRAKDAKQFKKVKDFIDDLYSKTNLMDFPRYPIDSSKNEHFFVAERQNVVVDLEQFKKTINVCSDILLRMGSYYEYEIEQKLEIENNVEY